MNINTIQTIPGKSLTSENLFTGSSLHNYLLWGNLIVEKRISVNWLFKLYRKSFPHDFWSVLSSATN